MTEKEKILAVPRPKGTVVKIVGKHNYVVKRTSKYINGKSIPVDLGTVGKIVDYQFQPLKKKVKKIEIEIKDFGNVDFAYQNSKEVLHELLNVYEENDAKKIYVIALLRVLYANVKNRDLKLYYDTSYISELFKVGISKQTISDFLFNLGSSINQINEFMINRINNSNSHIVVDGMLKNNNSDSSFSEFSRKGKVKCSADINIMYALDFQTKEPLAASVYQGNMLDKTAFTDFISRFNVKNGVIIGDKGFELNDESRKQIAEEHSMKYLIPIKRNSRVIKDNNLLECDKIINLKDVDALCKKTKVGNLFYYTIVDVKKKSSETKAIMNRVKNEKVDLEVFLNKIDTYGSIIFESNIDDSVENIYLMYKERWEIETMFNFYKNILDIKSSNVHSDYSIIATEFINYISIIIGLKMKKFIMSKNLNGKYSFKQILKYTSKIKIYKQPNGEWFKCKTLKYIENLANLLEITDI